MTAAVTASTAPRVRWPATRTEGSRARGVDRLPAPSPLDRSDLIPVIVVAACVSVYDDGIAKTITRYLLEGETTQVPATEVERCPWAYVRLDDEPKR